jgi:hypothetical protein
MKMARKEQNELLMLRLLLLLQQNQSNEMHRKVQDIYI